MNDIGDDVKIIGEKLLEHCEIAVGVSVADNFWYHATLCVMDSADEIFTEAEVAYMRGKLKEARRKHFSGMVIEALHGANGVNIYQLPTTKTSKQDAEESLRQHRERKINEERMKYEAELERMKAQLKLEQEQKLMNYREKMMNQPYNSAQNMAYNNYR